MKETRYFFVPQADRQQELPDEEAQHAIRVLRLQAGDMMMLMDGCGNFYEAVVTLADRHHCMYEIQRTLPQQPTWRGHLHLAVAPTKMMERTEWFAEKATEVGIDEFSFLDCQFSERRNIKTSRIERIVLSAVKQSRKAWMPQINELVPFKKFITSHAEGHRFIAHCYDEIPRTNLFDELRHLPDFDDVTVLVGPEGDFSANEVQQALQAGYVSVDLGTSRLRTETAALSAIMMMQLAQR